MRENAKYLLDNVNFEIPICSWIMYLDNFLGKEKAEEFYEYLINARDIKRLNDIRNLISCIGFSIYSLSRNEQLAFISIFKPFDTESELVANMKSGVKDVFDHYEKRNVELLKNIKKLGYSCEHTKFNWKDKKLKDTYQREYIHIIFSEGDTCEQFKKNIIKLAKKYNIEEVLITDNMEDKRTQMKLKSNIIDVNTGKVKENIEDTAINTVENYLSDLSGTKVMFNIPYENNKKILNKDVHYLNMQNYYSKQKQEKVKKGRPYSFNSAMIRSALLNRFKLENYNE